MIARVSAPGSVAHDRPIPPPLVGSATLSASHRLPTSESIRRSIGCALIIHLIIQTIVLDPSGAIWTDGSSNVSRPDPSGAAQIDVEHQATDLLVSQTQQLPALRARCRSGGGRCWADIRWTLGRSC
jgi:hypothetical protein